MIALLTKTKTTAHTKTTSVAAQVLVSRNFVSIFMNHIKRMRNCVPYGLLKTNIESTRIYIFFFSPLSE